jgi:hypothetical protein
MPEDMKIAVGELRGGEEGCVSTPEPVRLVNRLSRPSWKHKGVLRVRALYLPGSELCHELGCGIDIATGSLRFHIIPCAMVESPSDPDLRPHHVNVMPLQSK